MKLSRRAVVASGILTPLLAGAGAALADGPEPTPAPTPTGPPSLDELLRKPELNDVALSPDGTLLAVLRQQTRDGKRKAFFELRKTADIEGKPSTVPLGDFDVDSLVWASDDRLLINVSFDKDASGKKTGLWYGDTFVPIPVRRVVSASLDGRSAALLFNNHQNRLNNFFDLSEIVDMLPGDKTRILMKSYDSERRVIALYHVDIVTGAATLFERGMLNTFGWAVKDGIPVLRYDISPRRSILSVYSRPVGETEWTKIRDIHKEEGEKLGELGVISATTEPGKLLAIHREDGEETTSLRHLDIKTLTFGAPLMTSPGHDIDGAILDYDDNLVAACFTRDLFTYDWVDKAMAARFDELGAALGPQRNIYPYDVSGDLRQMVLKTTSPTDPGGFHYYDFSKKALKRIGDRKPWLAPGRLAPMTALTIKSRDGVDIPAYLTTPLATGPRPLVVMPHGGPELRDSYDWDIFGQALAAQGWLVLQPNFRGSGGYGRSFVAAGEGHWGDRMQEDVDDCVRHVMASDRVDKSRIAIFGGSYGGYASLMGAIRNPDLYRCAVSVAGVSDLEGFLAYYREEGEDSPAYKVWRTRIGDPRTQRAAIRAASPVNRAEEIKAPVLLIHGLEDWIVEPRQSKLMANALRKAGKPVEHLELKGVNHRGWDEDTFRTILDRSITFIGKAFA